MLHTGFFLRRGGPRQCWRPTKILSQSGRKLNARVWGYGTAQVLWTQRWSTTHPHGDWGPPGHNYGAQEHVWCWGLSQGWPHRRHLTPMLSFSPSHQTFILRLCVCVPQGSGATPHTVLRVTPYSVLRKYSRQAHVIMWGWSVLGMSLDQSYAKLEPSPLYYVVPAPGF